MKNKKRIDILNMVWGDGGRDAEMVIPIRHYAVNVLGLSWQTASVFDFFALFHYKPKVLFLTNSIGDEIFIRLTKYAKSIGLKVLTLTTEGNFKEEAIEEMIWGWNKEKILYEDKWGVWSKKALKAVIARYPHLKEKIFISGGVGFDRYKIYRFINKEEFTNKYGKQQYKKIITYATWSFDRVGTEKWRELARQVISEHEIGLFEEDKRRVKRILNNIIGQNRDILFIIKVHPDDTRVNSETEGLEAHPNVLLLKNEEPLGDLINISDLWLVYDSTTVIEAWLLGKITMNINPTNQSFLRDNNYLGSIWIRDENGLQNKINEFYAAGTLKEFADKQQLREQVIKDVIEWEDGKNHIRVANELKALVERADEKFICRTPLKMIIRHILIEIVQRLPKAVWGWPFIWRYSMVHELFAKKKFDALVNRYARDLDRYYKEKGIIKYG
jgi:hypothetical protein